MSKTNPKYIMVMTCATSGIGAQAVIKQSVASPDTLVLTGVRGKASDRLWRESAFLVGLPVESTGVL
jgi:hypothetical protein